MGGACDTYRGETKVIQCCSRETLRKILDGIDGVDRIHVAHGSAKCQDPMNTIMKLGFHKVWGILNS
jgi:hypothetical protein